MMEKNLSLDKNNELKLEDAMRRLDEVVALLDRENVDLEESLRLYEEGVRLVAFCTAKLNDAERKIHLLRVGTDGEIVEEPFSQQ